MRSGEQGACRNQEPMMAGVALILPLPVRARSEQPRRPSWRQAEDAMNRKHYGFIAGIASAMAAAWWWSRRDAVAQGMSDASHERGETIFSNSPVVD